MQTWTLDKTSRTILTEGIVVYPGGTDAIRLPLLQSVMCACMWPWDFIGPQNC